MQDRPVALLGGAAVVAIEAAGVCIASVLSAIDTAQGKSYQVGSGIALSVIGFGTVAVLLVIAVAIAQARPWTRTPALLVHLFVGITAIYLLQGHRPQWGGPGLALAVLGFVTLLVPPSLRALNRQPRTTPPTS
jgi:hypothetical protein